MSTHNLCFGAEIGVPPHTPVLPYKSGVIRHVFVMDGLGYTI